MSKPGHHLTAALPISQDETVRDYLTRYVLLLREASSHADAYLIGGDSENLVKARQLARNFVDLTVGLAGCKEKKSAKINRSRAGGAASQIGACRPEAATPRKVEDGSGIRSVPALSGPGG